jgi:hypothetical protein
MNKDVAIQYARNGWWVFPLYEPQGTGCSCGQPECGKPGKHPRIPNWPDASCDEATVAGYWQQWPDANIGLRLDGLAVLDVDGPEGLESLHTLEQAHGTLAPCIRQRSGSGGGHCLFEAVAGAERRIKFRPGLDYLTGPSSYVVVEPSQHACGGGYKWLGESSPLTELSQ